MNGKLEKDAVEGITSKIRESKDWEYHPKRGGQRYDEHVDATVGDVSKETQMEYTASLTFDHAETDGQLHLIFEGDEFADAWLSQPLDPQATIEIQDSYEETEGSFATDLLKAYGMLETEYGSDYTKESAGDILNNPVYAEIPAEYSDIEVEATFDGISQISTEVAELHEAIYQPVKKILE